MTTEVRSTIGTDAEFFMMDKATKKLVSSIGKIPGTKEEPFKMPNGGGLQHDNVLVEFASQVAVSGEDLVDKVRVTLIDIANALPAGTTIVAAPSASMDPSELQTEEAKEFGCDPDYNAWSIEINPKPCATDENFRSAAAHLHVGHVLGDGNDFLLDGMGKIRTIRAFDAIIGVSSVTLDNSKEAADRRQLYGKAGCHRPTEYGVEYRVISNFWMKSPKLVLLIDSLAQDALKVVRENMDEELISDIGDSNIQEIINNNQVRAARMCVDTILPKYISKQSIDLLKECSANIASYELEREWK